MPAKETFEVLLARVPGLYSWMLRRRRDANLEKLVFVAVVRSGEIVLEVGANSGYYTLLFSNLVGRNGHVYAFEPVPPTYDRLSDRIGRHRAGNVTLNNFAVGDQAGPVTLHLPDDDHGQASLVTSHHGGSWRNVAVTHDFPCEMIRLDDYRQNFRGRVNFFKCDVEGAELLVLQGASEFLASDRPVVHIEVCPDWMLAFGYSTQDLLVRLRGAGYRRFFRVDARLQEIDQPEATLGPTFKGSTNLLCFVPSLHDDVIKRVESLARCWTGQARASGGS